eukprot:1195489-Prorocentrum_minimum.AAC.3
MAPSTSWRRERQYSRARATSRGTPPADPPAGGGSGIPARRFSSTSQRVPAMKTSLASLTCQSQAPQAPHWD